MILVSRTRRLDLNARPKVIGIINCTPDSFYDGGKYTDTTSILALASQYIREGADILELGAESTNQHSKDLSAEEEFARLEPTLQALRSAFPETWISVDTYKATVADRVLELGVDLINDVTAGRADARMFEVITKHSVPIVLMYSKDLTARTTVAPFQYDDVVRTIHDFLESRIAKAQEAGVRTSQIIVDPGLGHFVSSEPKYSYTILDHLREFTDLGPVLVSPSRKSFLAGPKNDPPSERLPATLRATEVAQRNGVSFLRTHDVGATVKTLESLVTD